MVQSAAKDPAEFSPEEAAAQLRERRRIWSEKYPIRACYEKWVRLIRPWSKAGTTLEIGGGSGLLKEVWGEGLVSTDLVPTPWIDFPLDATQMHVGDAAYDNVLCVDALHHFKDPHAFIDEAARVTRDRGRLILLEPWITPISYLFFNLMHHEEVWFKDYQHPGAAQSDPWTGNLALANIVLKKEGKDWPRRHPEWRRICLRPMGLLDFQVAGGFKPWALVRSKPLYDFCLKLDDWLAFLMPLAAFRVLAVFERV
ncbi:class I SAM-dependent methyltransferase, partial [Candidatus Sumerlaeota bacterium]|nr:class I SAM-dependent methyltransferase [Candidatus Sumerlaeota bacterium]